MNIIIVQCELKSCNNDTVCFIEQVTCCKEVDFVLVVVVKAEKMYVKDEKRYKSLVTSFDIIVIVECANAFILHSFGLYLILTIKKKKVMTLLMMHLSFIEILCALLQGIERMHRYVCDHWLIETTIYYTILNFTIKALEFTLIAISLERVLAVKLTVKFCSIVTKRRVTLVVICIWLLSLALTVIMWYISAPFYYDMLIFDSFLVLIYICSYVYIFVTVGRRRRKFSNSQLSAPLHNDLNLKVPLLLIFGVIFFYLIPDIVFVCGVEMPSWFDAVFIFNMITDAPIYIFGMPECRKRLKNICCCSRVGTPNAATIPSNMHKKRAK